MRKDINAMDILNKIGMVYFLTQYGKLMPGIIHNLNGKIAPIDSKIQLGAMKSKMKLKKLQDKKEDYGEEAYALLEKEYNEQIKMFESMTVSRKKLNELMSNLNNKVSTETYASQTTIDLNEAIKNFDYFFHFYKRYKHDVETEINLNGNAFLSMSYRHIYFLLYVLTKNAVDATYYTENETNKITITTDNSDEDFAILTISNNGKILKEKANLFMPLFSDKLEYFDTKGSDDEPEGAGLDLFFLKLVLKEYNVKFNIKSSDDETSFIVTLPKK